MCLQYQKAGLLSKNERRGTGLASVFFSWGAGTFLQLQSGRHPGRASCQVDAVLRVNFALVRSPWQWEFKSKSDNQTTANGDMSCFGTGQFEVADVLWSLLEEIVHFLSLRGFCPLWRSRRYFLQLASCYYNQHLVLVFYKPERMCLT